MVYAKETFCTRINKFFSGIWLSFCTILKDFYPVLFVNYKIWVDIHLLNILFYRQMFVINCEILFFIFYNIEVVYP